MSRADRIWAAIRGGDERGAIVPVETAIAAIAVYGGACGVFHFGVAADALNAVIGDPWADLFAGAYLLAGLLMLAGIFGGRANIEAGGIALVVSSLLVRSIALVVVVGFDSLIFNQLVANALISLGLARRMWTLGQGDVVIRVRRGEKPR